MACPVTKDPRYDNKILTSTFRQMQIIEQKTLFLGRGIQPGEISVKPMFWREHIVIILILNHWGLSQSLV